MIVDDKLRVIGFPYWSVTMFTRDGGADVSLLPLPSREIMTNRYLFL